MIAKARASRKKKIKEEKRLRFLGALMKRAMMMMMRVTMTVVSWARARGEKMMKKNTKRRRRKRGRTRRGGRNKRGQYCCVLCGRRRLGSADGDSKKGWREGG